MTTVIVYVVLVGIFFIMGLMMMAFTYPELLFRWAKGLGRLFIKGVKALVNIIAKGVQHAQWFLFGKGPHGRIRKAKSAAV
jgi:NADH:ubiquinone oxidoreductase subunit 6 (subunit J)